MWLEGGGKDKQVNRLQRGMTSTTKTYMFLPSWGHGRLAALPQAPRSCIERHSDLWFMRGVNLSEWTAELSSSLYWLSILGRQIRKKKKKNSGSLGASREFLKLCKPFPLFPYHFTPPPIRHLLQIVGAKQYSKPEKKRGGREKLTKSNFYAKFYFSKVTLVVSHSPFQIFLRSFPSLQLSFHWCLWKARSTYALERLGVIAQVSLRNRYVF